MEKAEAIREYCIERALEIIQLDASRVILSTEDVIKSAKELENYITK